MEKTFSEMEQIAEIESGKFMCEMEAKYRDEWLNDTSSYVLDYMSKDEIATWHMIGHVSHEAYCAKQGIIDEEYEQKSLFKWVVYFSKGLCICRNCCMPPFSEELLKMRKNCYQVQ